MILAVQRPIGCPGVAACIRVTATIGAAAIERPMGSADQSWSIDRPGRSTHSPSHSTALRQPVRFALVTQYQVGLYSQLGAAFQQRMLILFQRLRHRLVQNGIWIDHDLACISDAWFRLSPTRKYVSVSSRRRPHRVTRSWSTRSASALMPCWPRRAGRRWTPSRKFRRLWSWSGCRSVPTTRRSPGMPLHPVSCW
ncbi:hypothetical protein D3C78_938610 [compost metagenome]